MDPDTPDRPGRPRARHDVRGGGDGSRRRPAAGSRARRAATHPGTADGLGLHDLPGLGPEDLAALGSDLGVVDLDTLEYACWEGRLARHPGFGDDEQERLAAAVAFRRRLGPLYPAAAAARAVAAVEEALARAFPGPPPLLAGELRRGAARVTEAVLVCAGPSSAAVAAALVPTLSAPYLAGRRLVRGRHPLGVPIRVVIARQGDLGTALVEHTGSPAHVEALARRARAGGLRLEAGRLFDGADEPVPCPDEGALYRRLGLPFVPPELREGLGEIEAAEASALPRLLEVADLLGPVHVHTTASDGTMSADEVIAEAVRRRWALVGLADHAPGTPFTRSATAADLARQRQQVRRHNRSGAPPLVLHGVEAEIGADGAVLLPPGARFDYHIAAVRHPAPSLDRVALLAAALQQPRPGMIIAHPEGRPGSGPEPDAELAAVLALAAERAVPLEVDGHPLRPDPDWRVVRAALGAGMRLVVGVDAHRRCDLDGIAAAVTLARRGWARPGDVLNAGPWPWW